MKISSFENIMKYITKYRNNPKKIYKLKENFIEYLDLCNEQNIMDFILEEKYYQVLEICISKFLNIYNLIIQLQMKMLI